MKKYTLLPSGAIPTRYETKKLFLDKRVTKGISIADGGICLSQGTNHLIIDDDVKISEDDLKKFVDENFNDSEIAYKRINSIVNPTISYKTIF